MANRTPLRDILDTYRDHAPTREELANHLIWADENLTKTERREILDNICADMVEAVDFYREGHHADARRTVARIDGTYGPVFHRYMTAPEAQRRVETDAMDERGLADLITRKGA